MPSPSAARPAAPYRPGDHIGTSRGQLVLQRFDAAGRAVVRSRTSTYTLPAGVADRTGIQRWAERQIQTGGIGTRLYPKPGEYDASRVARAHARVASALGGPVVWQRELAGLNAAVTRLTGAERQALVNHLANTPSHRGSMLQRWISEAVAPGMLALGPLSATQRRELFESLVDGQDPINLDRIARAARDGLSRSGKPDARAMTEFVEAVSRKGSWEQRLGLMKRLSDDAVRGEAGAARSLAVLFAGLRQRREVEAAFAALDRPTTDAMVAAALPMTSQVTTGMFGGSTVQVRGDTSLFRRMAAAAALSANAREKASFVAASGALLEQARQINVDAMAVRRELLGALSRVIATDVGNVIDNTLLQTGRSGSSSGRKALRTWIGSLLDTGMAAYAGVVVVQLQQGPGAAASPMSWLSAQSSRNGEAPAYHRARVLGEFLGAVAAEVESRQRSRDLESAVGYALFAGTAESIKEVVSVAAPPAKLPVALGAAGVKAAVATALLSWRTSLRHDETNVVRWLHETALPRHPNGVEATAPWVTTFNAHFFASLRR
jgi:hypothetical protein